MPHQKLSTKVRQAFHPTTVGHPHSRVRTTRSAGIANRRARAHSKPSILSRMFSSRRRPTHTTTTTRPRVGLMTRMKLAMTPKTARHSTGPRVRHNRVHTSSRPGLLYRLKTAFRPRRY